MADFRKFLFRKAELIFLSLWCSKGSSRRLSIDQSHPLAESRAFRAHPLGPPPCPLYLAQSRLSVSSDHISGGNQFGVNDSLRPPLGIYPTRQHIKGSVILQRHACLASRAHALEVSGSGFHPSSASCQCCVLGQAAAPPCAFSSSCIKCTIPISQRSCED